MDNIIAELFSSNSSIGVIIFAVLLFYVVADIVKKSNRIDELLRQLTLISKDLHDVRNTIQLERATGDIIRRDVEELKKLVGSHRDRVVKIEAMLKARQVMPFREDHDDN